MRGIAPPAWRRGELRRAAERRGQPGYRGIVVCFGGTRTLRARRFPEATDPAGLLFSPLPREGPGRAGANQRDVPLRRFTRPPLRLRASLSVPSHARKDPARTPFASHPTAASVAGQGALPMRWGGGSVGQVWNGRISRPFSPRGRRWPEGPDEGAHRHASSDKRCSFRGGGVCAPPHPTCFAGHLLPRGEKA